MRINYLVLDGRISYLEVNPGEPPVRVIQFINPATGKIMRTERIVLDAGWQYPPDTQEQTDRKEE